MDEVYEPGNVYLGPAFSGLPGAHAVSHDIQTVEVPTVYQCIYERGAGHSFVIEVSSPKDKRTVTSYMSWDHAYGFGQWIHDEKPRMGITYNFEKAPLGGCRGIQGENIKLYGEMLTALSSLPSEYEKQATKLDWKKLVPPGLSTDKTEKESSTPHYAAIHETTLWRKLPAPVGDETVSSGLGTLQCRAFAMPEGRTCEAPKKSLEKIYGDQLLWWYDIYKSKNPRWIGPKEASFHNKLADKIQDLAPSSQDQTLYLDLMSRLEPLNGVFIAPPKGTNERTRKLEQEFWDKVGNTFGEQQTFWDKVGADYLHLKKAKPKNFLEGLRTNPTTRHRRNGTDSEKGW